MPDPKIKSAPQPAAPLPLPAHLRPAAGLLLFSLYTALGAAFTFPLVLHLTTHIPGVGNDGIQFVWGVWHWKRCLLQGLNPFFTRDLYYPLQISLLMHTWAPVKTLLMVPFLLLGNEIFAYNLGFLLTFGLKGLGAFLMLRTFRLDNRAAFLGGLVFAFAPYQMAHGLGHFHTFSNEAIPWIIYLWRSHLARGHWLKRLGLAGWALYLFFCDYQGFIFMLLFAACYFVYLLWHDRRQWLFFLQQIAPVAGAVAAVLGLFILAMSGQIGQYNLSSLHEGGWGGAQYFCLDGVSPFMPSELHPLWGKAAGRLIEGLRLAGSNALGSNVAERTATLGVSVLAVMLLGFSAWSRESNLRFWASLAGIFFLFTLGPVIRVLGVPVNAIGHFDFFYFDKIPVTFPAPYTLIHYLPVLNGLREPGRFILVTVLGASVLFAVSFQYLLQRRALTGRQKSGLFLLLFGLILVEYWTAPYPAIVFEEKKRAYEIIRQDPEQSHAVLDLPSSPWIKGSPAMYFQTIHNHPIAGGNTSKLSRLQQAYRDETAVLSELNKSDARIDPQALKKALDRLGVYYVVSREETISRNLFSLQAAVPGLQLAASGEQNAGVYIWRYMSAAAK